MGRSRKTKQRKKRERQKAPPEKGQSPVAEPPPNKSLELLGKRTALRVWELFVALTVVVGIAVVVWPRLTVSVSSSLNPADPFSAPFTIVNEGYFLPVRDINVRFGIYKAETRNCGTITAPTGNFSDATLDNEKRTAMLWPNEGVTATSFVRWDPLCHMTHADVAVLVSFRDWAYLKHRWSYRFSTIVDKEGHLHWYPQPLN